MDGEIPMLSGPSAQMAVAQLLHSHLAPDRLALDAVIISCLGLHWVNDVPVSFHASCTS